MAKRPTKQQPKTHSRAVYHIKRTLAKLVAIVDAETAIARTIEQENVLPNERGRLGMHGPSSPVRCLWFLPRKITDWLQAREGVRAVTAVPTPGALDQ